MFVQNKPLINKELGNNDVVINQKLNVDNEATSIHCDIRLY